jgi:type IV secretion system protein VirB10
MAEKDERPTEMENEPPLLGTIKNKIQKPAGLLPKNTQQMVILSVAVVMVLILWLTGGSKHPTNQNNGTTATPAVRPPDPATVQDFKQTIQKEQAATRQPISPADFDRLKSLGLAGDVPPSGIGAPPEESNTPPPGAVIGTGATAQQPPPLDPVKEDKKKREYLSLFAPNVAFTYRKGAEAEQFLGTGSNTSVRDSGQSFSPTAPTSLEAQLREAENQLAAASHVAQAEHSNQPQLPDEQRPPKEVTPANPNVAVPGAFNAFTGKRYVIFEGTVLETLLINRLNGTFAGPVNCLVTSDIYSHDGQHILIPAGTKVLGEAKKVEAFGQQRLAVVFHRLLMPDGFSVSLDQFKGLSQTGETSLHDKVNNHYLQIFGASVAVGVLGGIAQVGTGNAFTNSGTEEARAAFGSSLAASSEHILDRFLNILPTVTIREGNRVKIYLSGDLLLPDYNQHAVQPDI